jgi:DNA (cytosine-5)-methyltransferase 1
MRYASVCSGVEAASLAWMPLGWTPVFFAEVEPFPCAVLQQRFNATKPLHPLDPAEATDEKDRKMRESWKKQLDKLPDAGTIPNLGDFTKINGEDYVGTVDLLVGGTPCQDLSVAGKRAGFGDIEKRDEDNAKKTRSSLAIDFVRLAYETGCRFFVWENVPGALSCNGGRDFSTLLSWFVGYRIEPPKGGWKNSGIAKNRRRDRFGVAWRVLDAQFTRTPLFPHAVPQRRRRVFLVGCLGDWERAATILLEPDRLCWDTPPRIKTRKEAPGDTGTGSAQTVRMRAGCEGGGQGSISQ